MCVFQSIDIQSQIDAINVDLTTIDLISTQTENQLNDFASAVNIPYSTFATVVRLDPSALELLLMPGGISWPSRHAIWCLEALTYIYNRILHLDANKRGMVVGTTIIICSIEILKPQRKLSLNQQFKSKPDIVFFM